ncbi:hypothetical protein AcV5_000126 [Taiwanofungus camphoratus]|nr:hypothetical protein AcV5_000126 [Antrodia cinnamomea]
MDRPTPLVIYVFINKEDVKQKFLDETRSGTLVLNDTIPQLAAYEVGLGGQGDSGYGSWGGKLTFDTFTHGWGYVNVPPAAERSMSLRYPPYTEEAYQAMTAAARFKIPDA